MKKWMSIPSSLLLQILFLLTQIATNIDGYSRGAGQQACGTMLPWHGGAQQNTPAPFEIKVSQNTYQPLQQIRIDIKACGNFNFKGFLVQARLVQYYNQDIKIGVFGLYNGAPYQYTCADARQGTSGQALTHVNNSTKTNLALVWQAPRTSMGHILFRVTIVENFSTYWVGVNSPIVWDTSSNIRFTQQQIQSISPEVSAACRATTTAKTNSTTSSTSTTTMMPTTTTTMVTTTPSTTTTSSTTTTPTTTTIPTTTTTTPTTTPSTTTSTTTTSTTTTTTTPKPTTSSTTTTAPVVPPQLSTTPGNAVDMEETTILTERPTTEQSTATTMIQKTTGIGTTSYNVDIQAPTTEKFKTSTGSTTVKDKARDSKETTTVKQKTTTDWLLGFIDDEDLDTTTKSHINVQTQSVTSPALGTTRILNSETKTTNSSTPLVQSTSSSKLQSSTTRSTTNNIQDFTDSATADMERPQNQTSTISSRLKTETSTSTISSTFQPDFTTQNTMPMISESTTVPFVLTSSVASETTTSVTAEPQWTSTTDGTTAEISSATVPISPTTLSTVGIKLPSLLSTEATTPKIQPSTADQISLTTKPQFMTTTPMKTTPEVKTDIVSQTSISSTSKKTAFNISQPVTLKMPFSIVLSDASTVPSNVSSQKLSTESSVAIDLVTSTLAGRVELSNTSTELTTSSVAALANLTNLVTYVNETEVSTKLPPLTKTESPRTNYPETKTISLPTKIKAITTETIQTQNTTLTESATQVAIKITADTTQTQNTALKTDTSPVVTAVTVDTIQPQKNTLSSDTLHLVTKIATNTTQIQNTSLTSITSPVVTTITSDTTQIPNTTLTSDLLPAVTEIPTDTKQSKNTTLTLDTTPVDIAMASDTTQPQNTTLTADTSSMITEITADTTPPQNTTLTLDTTPVDARITLDTTQPQNTTLTLDTTPVDTRITADTTQPQSTTLTLDTTPVDTIITADTTQQQNTTLTLDTTPVDTGITADTTQPQNTTLTLDTTPVDTVITADTTQPQNTTLILDTTPVDTRITADTTQPQNTTLTLDTTPVDIAITSDTTQPQNTTLTSVTSPLVTTIIAYKIQPQNISMKATITADTTEPHSTTLMADVTPAVTTITADTRQPPNTTQTAETKPFVTMITASSTPPQHTELKTSDITQPQNSTLLITQNTSQVEAKIASTTLSQNATLAVVTTITTDTTQPKNTTLSAKTLPDTLQVKTSERFPILSHVSHTTMTSKTDQQPKSTIQPFDTSEFIAAITSSNKQPEITSLLTQTTQGTTEQKTLNSTSGLPLLPMSTETTTAKQSESTIPELTTPKIDKAPTKTTTYLINMSPMATPSSTSFSQLSLTPTTTIDAITPHYKISPLSQIITTKNTNRFSQETTTPPLYTKAYTTYRPRTTVSSILMAAFQHSAAKMVITKKPAERPLGPTFPSDPQCNRTKGCFHDCRDQRCTFLISWVDRGSEIDFQMKAIVPETGDKWIAIGFSYDQRMGSDSVTECVTNGGLVNVYQSYNLDTRANARLRNPKFGISNEGGSLVDGVFTCRFTRQKVIPAESRLFDLNKDWHILFAHGTAMAAMKLPHQYRPKPAVSPKLIDLQEYLVNVPTTSTTTTSTTTTTTPTTTTTVTTTSSTTTPTPTTTSTTTTTRRSVVSTIRTPVVIQTTTTQSSVQTTKSTTPIKQPKLLTVIERDLACGVLKGCYEKCRGDECSFIVSWNDRGDAIDFEIKAQLPQDEQDHWVAIGFSRDDNMGNDNVIECVSQYGMIDAYQSYNTATKTNERLAQPKIGLSNIEGSFINGIFTCKFTRKKVIDGEEKAFNLNANYHMMFAHGKAYDGNKEPHSILRLPSVSRQLIDLQSHVEVSSHAKYYLIKLHGCLMIIAWIFFASIGIIVARFYRQMWPEHFWCKERIWYQVHRACMITTFGCVIAGFILVFIDIKGYSQIDGETFHQAHPVMGIIVTVLVVTNPIVAMCRPLPGTTKRTIFDWVHRIIGMSSHMLAILTIFAGIELSKASAPDFMKYILMAYVVYQIFVTIVLEIHKFFVNRKEDKRNQTYLYEMHRKPYYTRQNNSSLEIDPPYSGTKKAILGSHILIIFATTMILIILLLIY